MKKRKFLATLLAVACVASLSVPSFAAEIPEDISDEAKEALQGAIDAGGDLITEGGTVNGVDIEATVQKPTLAIVLPKKVSVFVNPYRAEVKTGVDGEGNEIKSIDTVVSPEMAVVNGSNCAVKISVKGQFLTYKYLDDNTGLIHIADDSDNKITGWSTLTGAPADDTAGLFVTEDGKTYYAKVNVGTAESPVYQYRQVTVKYTAGKAATESAAAVPASYVISGITAATNIKVATAAVKEDTDKSNSIFMYVEGTETSGVYPAAYNKTVAGVDTKGNLTVGGQYALAAKEGQGAVLYLGGEGKTGYMRVTGSAATAPTKTWSEVEESEGFETPFVFIVDPVANAAENPELKTMTVTGGTLKAALASGKYTYDINVVASTTSVVLNVTTDAKSLAKGVADGTVVKSVANTGSTKVTLTIDSGAAERAKGSATFTVTSEHGKVNTYTINVNIIAAP